MKAMKAGSLMIVAMIVIATVAGCAPAVVANGIPRERLVSPGRSLGHASIGMTVEQLRNVFGQEQSVQTDPRRPSILFINWYAPGQPGTWAMMKDGKAIWIQAFMLDAYRTTKGIGVGSSKGDVLSLYGEPKSKLEGLNFRIGHEIHPVTIWEYEIGLSVTIRTDTESVVALGVTRAR